MNREFIKGGLVVLAASLLACTVGQDGKQGAPGVPCTGCVNSASIAAGAVTSTALGDGVVQTPNIAAKAVTGAQIADAAISTNHFTAGAVDTNAVADGSITTSKFAAGAVDSNAIASGAVGATQLASNAVLAGNIATGAVGTTQIANGSVTAAKIAPTQISELYTNVQSLGVVSSTTDEIVLSRFLGDLNGLTTMRVLSVHNGGTGRGGAQGGAGALTVTCSSAATNPVYSVALEGTGGSPWTHISPSFTCGSGFLTVAIHANAANAPVVLRQLEILHGH